LRVSVLEQQAEGIWTAAAPQRFYGLHLGTRMTVVRLPDRSLWLHSVIPVGPELKSELRGLGPVRHVVVPNAFHHLHAVYSLRHWPDACL
jgi:hypothetical protein